MKENNLQAESCTPWRGKKIILQKTDEFFNRVQQIEYCHEEMQGKKQMVNMGKAELLRSVLVQLLKN